MNKKELREKMRPYFEKSELLTFHDFIKNRLEQYVKQEQAVIFPQNKYQFILISPQGRCPDHCRMIFQNSSGQKPGKVLKMMEVKIKNLQRRKQLFDSSIPKISADSDQKQLWEIWLNYLSKKFRSTFLWYFYRTLKSERLQKKRGIFWNEQGNKIFIKNKNFYNKGPRLLALDPILMSKTFTVIRDGSEQLFNQLQQWGYILEHNHLRRQSSKTQWLLFYLTFFDEYSQHRKKLRNKRLDRLKKKMVVKTENVEDLQQTNTKARKGRIRTSQENKKKVEKNKITSQEPIPVKQEHVQVKIQGPEVKQQHTNQKE